MARLSRRRWLASAALAAAGSLIGRARAAARTRTGARVLIAGGGFAGASCALRLRQLNPAIDLRLIDPVDPYLTCPMSNEVIAGLRPLASLRLSRQALAAAGIDVVRDRVRTIDSGARRLRLESGTTLPFDRLVVAPGIRFLWERIEGYDAAAAQRMPHAWQAGEQTTRLAAQLRAMRDGGTVAISVPSGLMRCPPAPYERASLIAHYLQRHKPRSKILILDANNSFPRQAQFTAAWQRLYPNMIDWLPMTENGAVLRVDAASMTLFTAADAHRVEVANVIPPQAPGELAPLAGLAAEHGWCPIEPSSFESTLAPGIHVIGDACIADAMPKSASAALSQGRHCAAAVDALLSGRAAPAASLDSVCYSRLSPEWALALPGHFTIQDGRIVAAEALAPPGAPALLDVTTATQAARAADRWYARIRLQAFAVS